MLTMGATVRYGKAAKDMEVEAKPVRTRSSAACFGGDECPVVEVHALLSYQPAAKRSRLGEGGWDAKGPLNQVAA